MWRLPLSIPKKPVKATFVGRQTVGRRYSARQSESRKRIGSDVLHSLLHSPSPDVPSLCSAFFASVSRTHHGNSDRESALVAESLHLRVHGGEQLGAAGPGQGVQ